MAGLAALGAIAAITALQVPALQQLQGDRTLSDDELQQQLTIEATRLEVLKRSPAFGFDNLLADWTFLGFVQYFGDEEARRRTNYDLSADYFDIVLNRDPRFILAYTFLSASVSQYAAMPDRAIDIMNENVNRMTPIAPPNSFFVWRQKGIDELLFLGDAAAAQNSFETAAAWADQSPHPSSENIAAISRQTAQFLSRNPDSAMAQVGAWTQVLQSAVDDRTRERAITRIEELGGEIVENPDGTATIRLPTSDSPSDQP
jgi:hypothetical protein